MKNNFSSRVQMVIQFARDEALRLGHDYIGTEHLLLGLIRLDVIWMKFARRLKTPAGLPVTR